jgi:hypothetical protein
MKTNTLLTLLLLLSSLAFSQVKIGLNFSPSLAFSRLTNESVPANQSFNASGVGLRFVAGPEVSFYIGENAAFVTGAWYALKRASINSVTNGVHRDSVFNLQYIQLPATFKLFTNEIATDMKVYFQLGGTFDIKIAEKLKGYQYKLPSSQFQPIDASLLLGSGVEYQLGETTYFLVGIRYTRGLINSIKGPLKQQINVKNSLISLDLGIRF